MRFFALFLLSLAFAARANEIPSFTPNVVDPGHFLSEADTADINRALQVVREKADILGAVYVVDALLDDTIEDLAVRAFKQWKLGSKSKDNGLLLVLVMRSHQSRFEVGYGLEGDIPDIVARRALDRVLRPYMREGQTKTAIVKAFYYLAGIRSKDAAFEVAEVPQGSVEHTSNPAIDVPRGWRGWQIFFLCLWLFRPLGKLLQYPFARRLQKKYSKYQLAKDANLNKGRLTPRFLFIEEEIKAGLFVRAFFTVNPGVFIFFGSAVRAPILLGIQGACAVVLLIYLLTTVRKYLSGKNWEAYLAGGRRRSRGGHSSSTSSDSSSGGSSGSSSSDSSSSSSSSSDGGSSGGGGASSSW